MTTPRSILAMVLTCAAMSGAHDAAAQSPQVAHVSLQQVVERLPGYAKAEADMRTYDAALSAHIRRLADELEDLRNAYLEDEPGLAESERVMRLAEIETLEQQVTQIGEAAETSLLLRRQELLEPLVDEANALVRQVADERGYAYVLDTDQGHALHAGPQNDLLAAIEEHLRNR